MGEIADAARESFLAEAGHAFDDLVGSMTTPESHYRRGKPLEVTLGVSAALADEIRKEARREQRRSLTVVEHD